MGLTYEQARALVEAGKLSEDYLAKCYPEKHKVPVVKRPVPKPFAERRTAPNPLDQATATGAEGKRREVIVFPFLPPSWNTQAKGKRWQMVKRAKEQHDRSAEVLSQRPQVRPFAGPVVCYWTVYRPDALRVDQSNLCIKHMEDAIVRAGIIVDDSRRWCRPVIELQPSGMRYTVLVIEEDVQ